MEIKRENNSTSITENALEKQADLCQSLTHPFRLKILKLLQEGEKSVSDIENITEKPQPFISQHLKVLRDKGVVATRRGGDRKNIVYYKLANPKVLRICKLVEELISDQLNAENVD
ncbi:MAG: ArsR family transcriptional regulator [Candidatus Heimdallarchaeota archaeon]|nr:ArsR family transcriptional regulator [Candidatus Heimdallarchaeota archaeon]